MLYVLATEDLIGTSGAYLVDDSLNILGKVPIKELADTLNDMNETIFALIIDGAVDKKLAPVADKQRVKYIVTKSDKNESTKARIVLNKDL